MPFEASNMPQPGMAMPQPPYHYGASAAGMNYANAPYPAYTDPSAAAASHYNNNIPMYNHAAAAHGNLGFGLPPPSSISANSVGMGAVFKKRVERIDWRKIAALDVDRISRDMDVQSLQDNLMNITYCNLESEVDCRNMDPNFVKLFKLSQLSIEYMFYSQEYLANVMAGLESRLSQVMLDHESTKKQLEKQKNELVEVKKESHKRKKLLAAQQQILHSGAQAYHKCPFCPKAFVHESYCVAHIQRRHADQAGSAPIIQSAPVSPQRYDRGSQLERELVEVKERLRMTERQLIETEHFKMQGHGNVDNDEHQRMLESWKAKEKERQREEFESIRQMFLGQFEELNNKYLESERQLMKLRGKGLVGGGGTTSNLGELADDTDTETDRSRGIRSAAIRNALLSPERSMKDQMNTQTFTIEQRNQQEIARLDAVLKNSRPALSPPVSQPNTPKVKKDESDSVVPFVEEEMTRPETAATAAAGLELPIMPQHNELIKTAPPSSSAMKRSLSPGSPLASPRDGSPAKRQKDRPSGRAVYDRSDDDIDDDEESELREVKQEFTMWTNEEALKGALSQSTLGSTGPNDDRQGTDDSLIGTLVRSSRLTNQLGKDPALLKRVREELNQVLDEQLEAMGIPKDLTGISNVVLNNKLDGMEKNREIMDRKYSNFHKIRRQYERKVDRESREKWDELKKQMKKEEKKKAVRNAKSSSMPNLAVPKPSSSASHASPSPSPSAGRRSQPAPRSGPAPRSDRSPVVIRKETSSPAPQAPPRMSTTLSTEYSSAADTRDEYTDSDDYTENETEGQDEVDSPAKARESAVTRAQTGTTEAAPPGPRLIMSGPAPPPPPPPRSPERTAPKTPRDEISDWDSTEMSEVKPTVRANVKELSKSVDSQLKKRSPGERPFGGVNTLPSQTNGRHVRIDDTPEYDDDDLSISVSSLMDVPVKKTPAPAPRKGQEASPEVEFSTNTGGTSVWGSVSKAPGAPLVGVGKSSQSLTDWDSDLDIDDL